MLKFVMGFSKNLATAKERAAFFYNELTVRTRFEAIESQLGFNELEEPAWVTTIWYTELPDTVAQKEAEEKHEFIGSTGISPNDPNWREKLAEEQAQAATDSLTETQAWEDTTDRQGIDFEIHHVGEVE